MIDRLPILQPDEARAARTLNRCHQALARRRIETMRPLQPKSVAAERAVLTGLGMVYLISIVGSVVRMIFRG